jgi:predicted kinase
VWFVLVVGWPASGKSTLAAALAAELDLPLLAKDEVKEALMDGLGPRGRWPSRAAR